MANGIVSSLNKATEKAAGLKKGLAAFSELAVTKQAEISSTTPASQHDISSSYIKTSLSGYGSSILRDADAIKGIAQSFDEADRRIATSLLS